MNNYFSLDNHQIILWGNTSFAHKIYKNISENGYSISGIIEKNNTTFENIKISSFDEIKRTSSKNEVVFILCLRSSLNQEKLANLIYKEGYNRIIFAPLTMNNSAASYHMRMNYQQLLYGGVKKLLFPAYDLLLMNNSGYRVINHFKDSIELLVDVKYIRTFYRDTVADELIRFRDKPISEYDYLNELYDYLYENGSYPKNYLTVYMNGTKGKEFLNDRKILFDTFREGLKIFGWNFFETIPISVECKENGLNITDGMHRASFLYKEGAKMMPVVLSYQDFNTFVDMIFEEEFI